MLRIGQASNNMIILGGILKSRPTIRKGPWNDRGPFLLLSFLFFAWIRPRKNLWWENRVAHPGAVKLCGARGGQHIKGTGTTLY